MATATELVELTGVAQRTEGMRFELRDAAGNLLGDLNPTRIVSLANVATGVIKRTVANFNLAPSVASSINPLAHRVWAYWRFSTGAEYQQGQFLFASWAGNRRTNGVYATTRLLDQGLILGQPTARTVGFPSGMLVTDALASVFGWAGILAPVIAPATATLSSPLAWPAGSTTTWALIATQLCALGGLNDWYFDNAGTLRVTNVANLSLAVATLAYSTGGVGTGRIIAGSIVEQNDLLNAPNRYIAIDTANRGSPAYGNYDLPASAPNSIAQRGFAIAKVIQAPGVGSYDAAAAYAAVYAQTDPKAYETVTFSAAPDPRHDTFDVVNYMGINYQEIGWSLTAAPGGPHQHTLKRLYYV